MSQARNIQPDPMQAMVSSLRQGATPVPAWFLTHRERWRWLVETLMGHPRIRGGQRPRDYPGDRSSKLMLSQAVALHAQNLSPWGQMPRAAGCRFGSWLFAFVLIVETQVLPNCGGCPGQGPDPDRSPEVPEFYPCCSNPEAALARALDWVVWQALRALGRADDECAYHLILSTLGISPVEAPLLNAAGPKLRLGLPSGCRDALRIASEAAFYAGSGTDFGVPLPKKKEKATGEACNGNERTIAIGESVQVGHQEGGVPDQNRVAALLDGEVWTLYLKAAHVQGMIGRAKILWMSRGASAWVSQVLAAARDLLPGQASFGPSDSASRPFLLTDVGAFSLHAWASRPDCQAILEGVVKDLVQNLDTWNPKLGAFLKANSGFGPETHAPSACFPELCLEASCTTVRRLCAAGVEWNTGAREAEREAKKKERLWSTWAPPISGAAEKACDFVMNEGGLLRVDKVPWRRGEKLKPLMGWSGMAWSLAGATYKAHTLQGLGEMLHFPPLQQHSNHGEWMKGMGQDGATAYLFLDGNHVGKTFAALPPIRGFQAALDLLNQTQDGLLGGIQEVSRAVSSGKAPITLPVELYYLGGDDLVCALPAGTLPDFLRGFEPHAVSSGAASFTGIAILVPSKAGSSVPAVLVEILQGALKWAKATGRGETPKVSWDELVAKAETRDFSLVKRDAPVYSSQVLNVLAMDLLPLTSEVVI